MTSPSNNQNESDHLAHTLYYITFGGVLAYVLAVVLFVL